MRHTPLFALVAILGYATAVVGDSEGRRAGRGPARAMPIKAILSADSARVDKNELVLTGLDILDPDAPPRALGGRVLIEVEDPDVAFALGAATVGSKMARATPLLGHEGPAGKRLRFTEPVGFTLRFLDRDGAPRRTETVQVAGVRMVFGR